MQEKYKVEKNRTKAKTCLLILYRFYFFAYITDFILPWYRVIWGRDYMFKKIERLSSATCHYLKNNLDLDFDKIDVYSIIQQISFASYNKDTF